MDVTSLVSDSIFAGYDVSNMAASDDVDLNSLHGTHLAILTMMLVILSCGYIRE